jgi:hypothetical protein
VLAALATAQVLAQSADTVPPPPIRGAVDTRFAPTRAGAPPTSPTGTDVGPTVDFDLYALPEKCKNPDGTFNQDALVTQQKKRCELISKALATKFRLTETLHYLIMSDTDPAVTAQFQTWCEALYNHLFIQLGFPPAQHVWDGKCMLVLMAKRATFLQYARMFDHHDATTAGAYFAVDGWPEGQPQLVHVIIPTEEHNPRRLQELFAHEGTHAFFELYKKPGRLPLWLHEGLAEYMTIVNDRTLKPMKWTAAVRIVQKNQPIDALFALRVGDPFSMDDYSVATTVVDYLLKSSRVQFKNLIDTLKDGKEPEVALKAAYGFGFSELTRRWRVYVTADGGTKAAPAEARPMAP